MILNFVVYDMLVVLLCSNFIFAQYLDFNFTLPMWSVTPDYDNDNIGTDLEGMKQLFNDTLFGYDTRIRPRNNQSHIVEVSTIFKPLSIISFDTSEQKFSVLGNFRISWQDEVIQWNPDQYNNTNHIYVPVNEMWTPSLIISKSFDGDGVVGNQDTDISLLFSDGEVLWTPEEIYSVVCNVDIKYYPFDEQVCTITYYVSDETKVTVELDHPEDVTLGFYSPNSAWKITQISKTRNLRYNSFYIDISFSLQRRANFAIFTVIMPLLVLAFLNVCIFLVPNGSGKKGSFAITIFLSYGIFVTIVSDTLPDNSLQVSYFLLFIIVLLFMSVLSVFYTIIQAKLVSSIGHKECSIKCLRPKSKMANNNVVPGSVCEDELGGVVGSSEDEPYTWAMFLDKLDIVAFFVFFGLMVLSTTGFFSLNLKRINDSFYHEELYNPNGQGYYDT